VLLQTGHELGEEAEGVLPQAGCPHVSRLLAV
jgi:hypothetical protein